MQTTIRLVSRFTSKDPLVLLVNDKVSLPAGLFSKNEEQYIKSEFKAERKNILINQYGRTVAIYQSDSSKEMYKQLEAARKAGDSFLPTLNKHKFDHVVIVDNAGDNDIALAVAEGMALGNYQFLKYRKGKKKEAASLKSIGIQSKGLREAQVTALQNTADAVLQARTLVNEPPNFLTATQLSKEFVRIGKEAKFKVTVLNKSRIKALKMGGLLAVNKGSIQPPTFTIMEYKPNPQGSLMTKIRAKFAPVPPRVQ